MGMQDTDNKELMQCDILYKKSAAIISEMIFQSLEPAIISHPNPTILH
jgi:hypothetical protein